MRSAPAAIHFGILLLVAACDIGLLDSSGAATEGEAAESEVQRSCPAGTRRYGDLCCAAGTHKDGSSCVPDTVCGDNACLGAEDCMSCTADCGACTVSCGDGTCDAAEDCNTCTADCGTCPDVFVNRAFATQTAAFALSFDAVPGGSGMDGVMGASSGAADAYTDLAAIVRFNTTGRIDARNGGAYAAANVIAYSPGVTYHFRMEIDVPRHRYSAYVTVAGGTEQVVGLDYAFRTEQATVSQLDNLADHASTGTLQISNVQVSATLPPPTETSCPASGYKRIVNVSTMTALQSAVNNALSGDQIVMADGTYSGGLTIQGKQGTATDPITLCGSDKATISGPLNLTNSRYWRVLGFRVTNGWIGVQLTQSLYNRVSLAEISNVDYSGIKLHTGSNHNVITGNWVHDTGELYPKYGEGIYVGEGQTEATDAQRVADYNVIEGNRLGPNIRAEHVDVKPGTRGNRVLGNESDATGFVLIWLNGKTTGVYDASGTDVLVQGNTLRNVNWTPPPGESTPNWGVFRSYRSTASAVFTQNVIIGPTTARRAFDKDWAPSTIVKCDNVKPSTLPWGTTCTP
jgi:hypothetical protein